MEQAIGLRVIVRTLGDRPEVRVICGWSANGVLLVTDEASYQGLVERGDGPMPIGFRPDEAYVHSVAALENARAGRWGDLVKVSEV